MDGRFSDSPNSSPDDAGIPTPTAELKLSSSPKRSRRSAQKRVVTVPIPDTDGSRHKGSGEGAPPSDSWAWRKYGQKPIKGSPYPRGYYRCSSSKGCPARKQVERSRVDPTVLVVTYSGEHNHPWPRPKGQCQSANANTKPIPSPSRSVEDENPAGMMSFSNRDPADRNDRFSDLIGEDSGLLDYGWFADVGSPCSASPSPATDDFLLGPIACSADVAIPFADVIGIRGEEEEEEDSLFAGLGELPEFSVVLRRCGVAASL